MKSVAILGLGLMGGSLGLALKAAGCVSRVRGYSRRASSREEALRRGAVDEVFEDPGAAADSAELVVFCAPIRAIPPLVEACRERLQAGTVLTDVGSTKRWLATEIRARLQGSGALYVGSHPIAGSEREGVSSASAGLYRGAVVVVTPGADVSAAALHLVRWLWEAVGARVLEMDAAEHDRVMARTSHLPHLTAALLAQVVGRGDHPERWAEWCGTGFRDATRIAEGSPEVWHDIVQTNAAPVAEELRALASEVAELSRLIENGRFDSIKAFLEAARARRRALVGRAGKEAQG